MESQLADVAAVPEYAIQPHAQAGAAAHHGSEIDLRAQLLAPIDETRHPALVVDHRRPMPLAGGMG